MQLFLNLLTVPSHNAMFTQVSRVDIYAYTPLDGYLKLWELVTIKVVSI